MTELLDRIAARQKWLDRPAELIQKTVGAVYSALGPAGKELKSWMHGTKPLGHPLHPAVTDLPMGAWITGVVLDFVSHYNRALGHGPAEIALFIGLVAAVLAALTGYTDFHETYGHERRVAMLHGLTMTLVLVLMALSVALRQWAGDGAHTAAVGLSFAGAVIMLGGGYVGGHLVFAMGTMVNRQAFAQPPDGRTDIGAASEFPEGEVRRAQAGDYPVLVVRSQGKLCAIAAVCSHAGGPLDEGEFANGRIKCPWHGSEFDVCTGAALAGPAVFPQPAMEVTEEGGRVFVKGAPHPH